MKKMTAALRPIMASELASIGAIDTAMPHEREPGYVILLRSAKMGKQANVEQLSAMLRMSGANDPPRPAPIIEPVLKFQSGASVRVGTTPLLRAMRLAQAAMVGRYEALVGTFEGVADTGIRKCAHRARKQLVVLTAHIAMRGAKPEIEEQLALPLPLARYFANGTARVCFRCLFDRVGNLPPLERTDPHPYTYICAACHEETMGDLPPDILAGSRHWTERERQNIVIERALGRPSKLKAELQVLNKMSGLSPDLPPPPLPRKSAFDMAPSRAAKKHPGISVLRADDCGGDERDYIERLFDYRSVRENW